MKALLLKTQPSEILGAFFSLLLVNSLLRWIWPTFPLTGKHIVLLCIAALLLRRIWQQSSATDGWWQQMRKADGWPMRAALLRQLLWPPVVVANLRWQGALLRNFGCWLMRKPSPEPGIAGQKIEFMQQTQYHTLLLMGLISVLVDIPVNALLIGLMVDDPVRQRWIHAILLVLTLYLIILTLGDRWKIRRQYHVLTDTHLHLRYGERFVADIRRADISSATSFDGNVKAWCQQHRVSPQQLAIACPSLTFDTPNLLLELKPGGQIEQNHHTRPCPSRLLLFVDQPQHAIAALAVAAPPVHASTETTTAQTA